MRWIYLQVAQATADVIPFKMEAQGESSSRELTEQLRCQKSGEQQHCGLKDALVKPPTYAPPCMTLMQEGRAAGNHRLYEWRCYALHHLRPAAIAQRCCCKVLPL